MSTELEIVERREVAPLTAHQIKAQVQLIQEVMQAVMQEGYHFGVIPGTGDKPTLLKPGAEKLTMTFRLAPSLHVAMRDLGNSHREYEVRCVLTHIPTGAVYGEGIGVCSTLESKYRYRNAERTCPHCGKATIIKGRAEYGGGWLCFAKKGGCGEKFAEDDQAITGQGVGKVENPDPADQWNTVVKMAKKRALIDATLTATAASDIFTQDLDEMAENEAASRPLKTEAKPEPQQQRPAQQAKPAGNTNPITKGQLDIILISQRKAQVSDLMFKTYLEENYQVSSRKQIKQKDMNAVLEWLEFEHAKRIEADEERKALQDEGDHAAATAQ